MDYSESNITLSDSLSGYITANEDECDNSRYLSVLSQDLTLQEMNVTLSNERIEEHNGTDLVSTQDINQPLIFTVDGTDEIYGVQVAQDEDGNLQKYQIQYSENLNGELVPMLETIQLLPLDYEEQIISSKENCSTELPSKSNENFVNRSDEFISHNLDNDVNLERNIGIGERNQIDEDSKKLYIPTTSVNSYQIPIKSEPEDLMGTNSRLETTDGNIEESEDSVVSLSVGTKVEEIPHNAVEMENDQSNIMAIQHLEIPHCLEQEELYEETIEEEHFEQLFLEENHILEGNQPVNNEAVPSNDQHNGIFQILNSVAANSDNICDQNMHSILKETGEHHPKTNILKKPVQKSLLKDFINSEEKVVYIQTMPEKENLTVMDIGCFSKPNSRSILKCNQPTQVLKQSDHLSIKNEYPQRNLSTKTVSRSKEIKPVQTYLRTKEAKQARQFMNFINSTTIPQVPERKGKMPRKQQIKPNTHPDEDIVVKEMIVSSNGFFEPISAEQRKYLPVTEYVELLDSGDEMCNDIKKRKNNDNDELIEIEISDTDESNIGAVELETIPNGKLGNEARNGIKKKRGRPPKSKTTLEKKDTYPNSPPKISRLDSDVESVTSTLQVIRMENDAKIEHVGNVPEPNENTANNGTTKVEKSTKNECTGKSKVSLIPDETLSRKLFEYKYECEKCKTKFINKFLQSRHNCVSKVASNFSCDNCQQKFPSIANLNLHKNSHARVPPMDKPNVTKIPQVKEISKKDTLPTSSLVKSSVSTSRKSVVSKAPLKILKQSALPSKNPRPSSLCVKTSRGSVLPLKNKQFLSVKNTVQLSKNSSLPIKNKISEDASENTVTLVDGPIKKEENKLKAPMIKVTPEKTLNTSIFRCEKQCNNCSMRFENHASWFDHQVLQHGLKTPDKSIGEKKLNKIVKDKVVHNGIRTAPTVAKSFSMLKNMVQHI